jgi:predicted RecB family nuclease
MQHLDGRFVYSASDLNEYLECHRLAELNALVAAGKLRRPEIDDPQAELVRRKGDEHERRHLAALQARHAGDVICFERPNAGIEAYREAEERTRQAMAQGARIIYQATFFNGRFIGHADFLRRIDDVPSALGNWSYEVVDTKLALSTKPYFIVQLCNYSEHLARLQGHMPDRAWVVLWNGDEARIHLHEYLAYYRHLKTTFLAFAGEAARHETASVYPLARNHCDVCVWNEPCGAVRAADDHLSLVAWMRRDQIGKLETCGIATVASLATSADSARPAGMNDETFSRLRRQARLQVAGREKGPVYELLSHERAAGFGLLPAPAPGDVFFDMEGDPLYEPGRSLEYLFGCWLPDEDPPFRAFWGLDRLEERRAFEAFVDFVTERRRRYPAMHVYHYAPYEKTALRRLAQEHCTRENEVDDLLRGEVLVDLFAVVRQGLAIGEEHYSLKSIERFYAPPRKTQVKKGGDSIVMFERWLLDREQTMLDDIEAYNRDDCRSTFLLREWLLARREEYCRTFGVDLPFRPVKSPKEPCHRDFEPACKRCVQRQADEREEARRNDLERALLERVLPPQNEREWQAMSEDRRARYLLANLLAYHRREEKPAYWAYFDRCENLDRLTEFDREAIGGLQFLDDVPPVRDGQSTIFTYSFADQHYKLGVGDKPHDPASQASAGAIVGIDSAQNRLQLRRRATIDEMRAITALIPSTPIPTKEQRKSLARIAGAFLDGTLERKHRATFDLLLGRDPRVDPAGSLSRAEPSGQAESDARFVSTAVRALDESFLFIQGPPGTGKTTVAAEAICDLLQSGSRVAIASTGHKAIHNLLRKVEERAAERGVRFRGLYKHSESNGGSEYRDGTFVESLDDNAPFARSDFQLAAGTPFLFAREELANAFDYLFIDEAGQVALADALAIAPCARNLVLLGDPSQLAQVGQGRHPLHADDSVLQHLLGGDHTVPPHRGIFLGVSHRMHPQICSFVSQAMYDGRLHASSACATHRIVCQEQTLAGLRYVPIEHAGNASASEEEAAWIAREITRLLESGSVVDSWPREDAGIARPLRASDILVVTPYNAQRRAIAAKLACAGIDIDVGTVDKFQGREAAIVFYSMATSSGDEIPRSLQFLFERNRFNVAISRARALSVLVCSPRLFDIACRTADEMALVNLLCAFEEAGARLASA